VDSINNEAVRAAEAQRQYQESGNDAIFGDVLELVKQILKGGGI
jgi:hypothetical protein